MKSLLIIFIVLLFLLTLLSSFGGSITTSEPFYDGVPAYQPSEPPSYDTPHPESFETFTMNEKKLHEGYEDADAAATPAPPHLVPEYQQEQSVETTETFQHVEKIEIPHPFADIDSQVGAPF